MRSRKQSDIEVDMAKERVNNRNRMKKNKQRLGGGGLSLETFANAKTKSNSYNPALIKKKREFYKNAKYVSKFKRMLKHQNPSDAPSLPAQPAEDVDHSGSHSKINKKFKKNKGSYSLNELYEKQREEKEKARKVREAIIKGKEEERGRVEARRKSLREKMFKKTSKGQPVMKYRIEHLLETIQGSTS